MLLIRDDFFTQDIDHIDFLFSRIVSRERLRKKKALIRTYPKYTYGDVILSNSTFVMFLYCISFESITDVT